MTSVYKLPIINQFQVYQDLKSRFENHLTLGELIQELEQLPPSSMVQSLSSPQDYGNEGYYALLFTRDPFKCSVKQLLSLCKDCLSKTPKQGKLDIYVDGHELGLIDIVPEVD